MLQIINYSCTYLKGLLFLLIKFFKNFDYRYHLLIIYTSQQQFYLHHSYHNCLLKLFTSFKIQLMCFTFKKIINGQRNPLINSCRIVQVRRYTVSADLYCNKALPNAMERTLCNFVWHMLLNTKYVLKSLAK